MFDGRHRSWQLREDEPEDLHLALLVREMFGLAVAGSPGRLRDAPHPVTALPLDQQVAVAREWAAWWAALLAAHRATSGREPDGWSPEQAFAPRPAVDGPPGFIGLEAGSALRQLVVRVWEDEFPDWWEREPHPATHEADSLAPAAGVRGDLLTVMLTASRAGLATDVVRGLERDMHRPLGPFKLTIDVLAVHGDTATLVVPSYALVPVGLYADATRYPAWLRQAIAALA
jgi:hypothetical protein